MMVPQPTSFQTLMMPTSHQKCLPSPSQNTGLMPTRPSRSLMGPLLANMFWAMATMMTMDRKWGR